MNNITTCPACLTRFIVGRAQLKANQGQVKCTKCQHVFDYRQHLEAAHEQTVFLGHKPLKSARQHRRLNLAIGLLALIALVQFGFSTRSSILDHWPSGQSALIKLCNTLHCRVTLSQNLAFISLDDAELIKDENDTELMRLNGLLLNNAQYKQAFPEIELTLTDKNDRALIRKRVLAKDYLQESQKIRQGGLNAGEEIHFSVPLQTSAAVTGFRARAVYR